MKFICTDSYSFEWLRTNDLVYVDKTAYIWKLVSEGKMTFFFSRPRRFGKSLTISTLDCFFKNRRELFRGLAIDKLAPEDYWQEWPVVRLDMSRASSPRSIEETIEGMKRLLKSCALDYSVTLEENFPSQMLGELIEKLYRKYDKKVVILVDEYDKPLLDAMHKPYVTDMMDLMCGFYQQLKSSNEMERFVFLTGVSKFAHTSLFSGFNNPTDITRHADYATMLGYTQEELEYYFAENIEEATRQLGLSRDDLIKKMKANYDGFRFTDDTPSVYNPISIGKFFSEYKFKNYWWDTGTPRFLVELVKRRPFDLDEITKGWWPLDDFSKFDIHSVDVKDLAIQTGYLTIVETENDGLETMARYDFPNKEIRDCWYANMLALTHNEDTNDSAVRLELSRLRRLLDAADIKGFMERLEWFFTGMPYENVKANEGNFRNHLRTIFVLFGLPNQCEVQVARGRVDIVAQTRKCAFVFEVKMADGKDDVPAKIEEALKQAEEKHYADKYKSESEQVKVIALVFDRDTRLIAGWKELQTI